MNVNVAGSVNMADPPMVPVAGSNVNPPGSLPTLIDHVYGAVPPVAARVAEYGAPTTAVGSEVVVICNCAPEIVSVRLTEAVCASEPESVTLNVRGAFAAAVGVPLICPVDALRVRPAGSVPEVNCQLVAPVPPVDASVCEYADPIAPFGSDVVVITNCAAIVIVKFAVAVCTGRPGSVNLKLNATEFATAVGVPLI